MASNKEEPVDLKPFLKKGFFYLPLELMYRYIFQPLDSMLDWFNARSTRKFCDKNLQDQ